MEDLELAGGLRLADEHPLGGVVVGEHLDFALGSGEGYPDHVGAYFVEIFEGSGLLDGVLPEVQHVVGGFGRVTRDPIGAVLRLEVRSELLGGRGVQAHEEVPGGIGAGGVLRTDLTDLLFRDGEGHDRILGRVDARSLELLEEGDVGVTVQGVDDDPAIGEGLLDLGDDRGHLGVAERDVILADSLTTESLHLLFDDGIGRAGVHVIRAN